MTPLLTACALGPTPYREALALQQALVAARAAQSTGDWLLFPEHEPVLTVGRSGRGDSLIATPDELARRGIELVEVTRGGDVTWHGPGQLVGYTICDLDRLGRDVHVFLRGIEECLVSTLQSFGIPASVDAGRTGVWCEGRKIASIGIAVRRWVSYHGFALNVAPDLRFFELIHPCGLRGIQMTSVAARLGPEAPSLATVRERVAERFARRFGYSEVRWVAADEVRRAVPAPAGTIPSDDTRPTHRPALRRTG